MMWIARIFSLLLTCISGVVTLVFGFTSYSNPTPAALNGLVLSLAFFVGSIWAYRKTVKKTPGEFPAAAIGIDAQTQQRVQDFESQIRQPENRMASWFAIAICSVVSLLVFGKIGFNPTAEELLGYGGGSGVAVSSGELWRLFTPMFLHGNLSHLLWNMIAIYYVGPYVNFLYSRRDFAILFLATGVLGSALSASMNPTVVSVGASGAIFGLYGAVIASLFFRGDNAVLKGAPKKVFLLVGIQAVESLLRGAKSANIDNWAHLGGIFGGIAIGYFLLQNQNEEEKNAHFYWGTAMLVLGVLTFGVVKLAGTRAQTASERPAISEQTKKIDPAKGAELRAVLKALRKPDPLISEFLGKVDDLQGEKISRAEYLKWSREFSPKWSAAKKQLYSDFDTIKTTQRIQLIEASQRLFDSCEEQLETFDAGARAPAQEHPSLKRCLISADEFIQIFTLAGDEAYPTK